MKISYYVRAINFFLIKLPECNFSMTFVAHESQFSICKQWRNCQFLLGIEKKYFCFVYIQIWLLTLNMIARRFVSIFIETSLKDNDMQ